MKFVYGKQITFLTFLNHYVEKKKKVTLILYLYGRNMEVKMEEKIAFAA